jgi:hypothetical protein
MANGQRRLVVWTLGSLALAAAGCGGPQMAEPDGFADNMQMFETDDRDGPTEDGSEEEYAIGPYQVRNVKRNQTISEGFDQFDNFEPKKKGVYRYVFSGGEGIRYSGKCALRAPESTKDVDGSFSTDKEVSLACFCQENEDSVGRVFVEDLAGEYGGPLRIGDIEAQATGVYKLDNDDKRKAYPAGWRIDDDNGEVAAAGTMPGESTVWIKKGIKEPDKSKLVCLLAGLMLWFPEEPEQQSE